MNSSSSPSATRFATTRTSMSRHGWRNRAEAGTPKGAAIALEGGFDLEGQFYYLPIHDTARLTQLFRQRTIGLFLNLGLIAEPFAETLLRWRHAGFSVDNSVRLEAGDHHARRSLAQYIARAPLSLQKLTYDRVGGKVLYHTSYNPYLKQNTSLWDAADFIAALTTFIPPWGVRLIHYYGLYSSRCKARWQRWPHVVRVAPQGWRQSHAAPMPPQAEASEPTTVHHAACRSAWARLLAQVYEIDPLLCPRCGSQMRLIAVITDPQGGALRRPAEVRKILRHLVKIGRSPPGLDPSSLN